MTTVKLLTWTANTDKETLRCRDSFAVKALMSVREGELLKPKKRRKDAKEVSDYRVCYKFVILTGSTIMFVVMT